MADASGLPDAVVPMQQEHDTTVGAAALDGDVVKFTTAAPEDVAALPERVDLTSLSKAPDTALLENFLRRPVNIYEFDWDQASQSFHIDPWAAYLNNPQVRQKIANFRFMRGTLKIDIQLNGTPFHLGRYIVSYEPRNGTAKSREGDVRQHSVLPHIQLDPTSNAVGKMSCPFISPALWIDLIEPKGAQVGIINFDLTNTLKVFEGGTPTKVGVQVYAWIEEIELAFPTQRVLTPSGFTYQAKKRKTVKANGGKTGGGDEYSSNPNAGMISKPAAAIASAAALLGEVPVIGPFALATSIAVGAIGSVASLFGYSSPKDLTAPDVVLPRTAGNLVNCDSADQTISFTVSGKSELSIDPCVAGLNTNADELTIKNIASKWSLISSFDWNSGHSTGSSLYSESVSPAFGMSPYQGGLFGMTPAYHAALPFKKWRGSMEVRIQVVVSKFHRGRLRFQWTPEYDGNVDLNLSYNHVVDISDSTEFVLKLPYVGSEGFKNVPIPIFAGTAFDPLMHSGQLEIIVQNELACPTNEDITVLVWARCGDDMQFVDPDFQYVAMTTVSGPELPPPPVVIGRGELKEQSGQAIVQGESNETGDEIISFFDDTVHPDYPLAYYGDPVVSFRTLLKRYSLHTSIGSAYGIEVDNSCQYKWTVPCWPQMRGYTGELGGVGDGSWSNLERPAEGWNEVNTHLANYLSMAFLGTKGSFRQIAVARRLSRLAAWGGVQVNRVEDENGLIHYSNGFTKSATTASANARQAVVALGAPENWATRGGTQIFPSGKDASSCQIELPYYGQWRYSTHMGEHGSNPDPGNYAKVSSTQGAKYTLQGSFDNDVTGTEEDIKTRPALDFYYAAGEDFTCFFYLGPPQVYIMTPIEEPNDIGTTLRPRDYP